MTATLIALQYTRDLLAAPEHWAQGWYGFTADGNRTGSLSDQACRWCLRGAITKSTGMAAAETQELVVEALAETLLGHGIDKAQTPVALVYRFNDQPGRTHAEVLALIDETIARLGAEP